MKNFVDRDCTFITYLFTFLSKSRTSAESNIFTALNIREELRKARDRTLFHLLVEKAEPSATLFRGERSLPSDSITSHRGAILRIISLGSTRSKYNGRVLSTKLPNRSSCQYLHRVKFEHILGILWHRKSRGLNLAFFVYLLDITCSLLHLCGQSFYNFLFAVLPSFLTLQRRSVYIAIRARIKYAVRYRIDQSRISKGPGFLR